MSNYAALVGDGPEQCPLCDRHACNDYLTRAVGIEIRPAEPLITPAQLGVVEPITAEIVEDGVVVSEHTAVAPHDEIPLSRAAELGLIDPALADPEQAQEI